MKYKVCIPTAGTGSRLGKLSKGLNKSLIEINNKPAICYIIEKYDADAEFIIPIGYGGDIVRQFLELAYPKRNFQFVDIDLYEGEGSGLGYTLLKAKKFLQEPFIFNSCDTVVKDVIPSLDHNWIGYSIKKNNGEYRTISEDKGLVVKINDKELVQSSDKAYIGLAGIRDFKLFWQNLKNNDNNFINQGEAYGLKNLIINNPKAVHFNWFDTGNKIELNKTRSEFSNEVNHNILEKDGESIWLLNKLVIKYSRDKKFIKNRIQRSKIIKDFIPKIKGTSSNMYSYQKEEGEIISSNLTKKLFKNLLDYSEFFWIKKRTNSKEKSYYFKLCYDFYYTKTCQRLERFLEKYPYMSKINEINSIKVIPLEILMKKINWTDLCNGLIGRFHGDFHFENIIWNKNENKFIFLDWRQDFAGDISFGDIYYDFAKLNHGIIIQHEHMIKNNFKISFQDKKIEFDFIRNFNHVQCEEVFNNWLLKKNHSLKKVKILTALIYLNIAPLHHNNYDQFLFALGYYLLNEELKNI